MIHLARYSTEEYWERVGERLHSREGDASFIAGDDTLFYRQKRALFLERFLGPVVDESSSVLSRSGRRQPSILTRHGAPWRRATFSMSGEMSAPTTTSTRGASQVRLPPGPEPISVCGDGLHLFEDTAPLSSTRVQLERWLLRVAQVPDRVLPPIAGLARISFRRL